ncbi:MAG: hypothetical protein EOR73_25485 [Mesorhizobium sp.]|nr:MAG: hypothetical protein EOR73_25485 [Mesorhizobium sp.]
MNRLLACTLTAASLFVGLSGLGRAQDAVRIVDGRINVRDDSLRPVFLDDLKFYPGTKVIFRIDFRVDVMRRMYEDRECFTELFGGVWCEYIKRSAGSGIQQDAAPLILDLFEAGQQGGPMAAPVKTIPSRIGANTDPFDASTHLPAGANEFSILLDDADIQGAFTRGYTLRGRVAAKYKSGDAYPDIVRRPCDPHRNGEHCSQGEYVVDIVGIDTSAREKMLERYLARKRSYSEISGPDVIDRFMRSEVSDRTIKPRQRVDLAARLLVQHAREHHRTDSGIKNEDLRQILEYAVSLDQENVDARNDLVRYHIDAGNLAQAKERGAENLKKFSEDYDTGKKDKDTLRGLAQSLRNGGQIMLKDRAAVDLADVEAANGFFEKALAIWAEYELGGHPVDAAEREEIAQLYVDQARVLGLIRTVTAQQRAITKLELARLQLPKKGNGTPTAVSGDGTHFLTASFFQPLAEVAKSRVLVGYLPSDLLLPLQLRHSTGELLLGRLNNGTQSYSTWSSRRSLSAEEVVSLPAGLVLNDGRFFGPGLIGLDSAKRELVRIEAASATVLASDFKDDARWSAAEDVPVVAFARFAAEGKVTIWRDEKAVDLDVGSATVERVAVSPAGTHVQVLRKLQTGFEVMLADVEKLAKAEADSSVPHKFLPLTEATAELLFTQDGRYALQRASKYLAILPVAGGDLKVIVLDADASIYAVGGSRLAVLPKDEAGMTDSISSLDIADVYLSAVTVDKYLDAPGPQMKTLKFVARLPFEGLAVTSQGPSGQAPDAPLILLAKELPAVLQVHSVRGARLAEQRAATWRHGDAVLLPGGKHMTVRDRQANKVRLWDVVNSAEIDNFPGGTTKAGEPVTEIVPILGSENGGFFLIARDPDSGGVLSVTTYLEAKKGSGLSYELPRPVQQSGSQADWIFLRQPAGHLISDQPRATFVTADLKSQQTSPDPLLTRQEYDASLALAAPAAVEMVTVDAAGQISLSQDKIRDPGSIVARLRGGFVHRRETGFAYVGPTGESTYLDDCGPTTRIGECDGASISFSADGKSVTIARQGTDALDLTTWSVSADGEISSAWRCKACNTVAETVFNPLDGDFVGAQPFSNFALDARGRVLTAYEGGLGFGVPTDDKWSRKIPFARPVAVVGGMALVQREGTTFELWQGSWDGAR